MYEGPQEKSQEYTVVQTLDIAYDPRLHEKL